MAEAPEHACLLLAAGGSRRLGRPKQLVEIDGQPLLRRMTLAALQTRPRALLVALGAAAEDCRALIGDLPAHCVLVEDWALGMGVSLATLARAAPRDCALLVLGIDQPALEAGHLRALLARGRKQPARPVASAYAGVIGTPALFPPDWRQRLAALDGDLGARSLLRESDCAAIAAPQLAWDIDQAQDLP